MQIIFSLIFAVVSGFRTFEKSTLSLTEDSPLDNRLPFPQGLDITKLYCYDTLPDTPSIPALSVGSVVSTGSVLTSLNACAVDADCSSQQPFCVTGFCRECRSSSDCADPGTKFCSIETSFICSYCETDSDCGDSGKLCRAVSGATLDRKTCITCTSEIPPEGAILSSTSNCGSWKCPDNEMIGTDGSCTKCPTCRDGQFLIPGEFFSFSKPQFFFPTCSSSHNAKCIDCPTNPCASILSPSFDHSAEPDVGFLPPAYPCNAFKCNPGWYLDTTLNQCRLCQVLSCESGKFLNGCGGSSPGTCIDCPHQMVPSGTPFIDPKSLPQTLSDPKDVCRPQCSSGYFLTRTSLSTPWQCGNCNPTTCPPGTFLSGCGPGENPGECLPCASNPPAGWFWTPNHYACGITKCTTCEAGSALVGCGGSSAGTCSACLTPLPANAVAWTTEFDQLTMSNDTCSFNCASGYYRSGDECAKCQNCPIGQFIQGCGGRSPGHCIDCSAIGPSEYFLPSSNTTCLSAKCADTNEQCQPGQFLSSCGGTSGGTCESCGFALPPQADDWLLSSTMKCDFECKTDFYPSLNGTNRICIACSDQAKTCPIGTQLIGCSNKSPGTCQPCPPLPDKNSFYGPNCSAITCSPSSCGDGYLLVGCGGTSAGTCISCDSISGSLPNSSGWVLTDNTCTPKCSAGFYLGSDKTACIECSLTFCRPGYVLSDCGGSNPGRCIPCDLSPLGLCYTGPGGVLGATNSCSTGPCPQQI